MSESIGKPAVTLWANGAQWYPYRMVASRFLGLALEGSVLFIVASYAQAELAPMPGSAQTPPPSQGAPQAAQQRYSADKAEYNTEQRKEWLAKCEPLREVDFKGYRACFEKEKQRSSEDLKRRFIEVEKRQGQPFRNVNPTSNVLDEPPRNPAFDVEVEKN